MPAIVRRPRAGWSPARRCRGRHNEGGEGVGREKGVKESSQTAGGPGPAVAARLQLITSGCETAPRLPDPCQGRDCLLLRPCEDEMEWRKHCCTALAGAAGRLWWVGPTGAAIKTSCHPRWVTHPSAVGLAGLVGGRGLASRPTHAAPLLAWGARAPLDGQRQLRGLPLQRHRSGSGLWEGCLKSAPFCTSAPLPPFNRGCSRTPCSQRATHALRATRLHRRSEINACSACEHLA